MTPTGVGTTANLIAAAADFLYHFGSGWWASTSADPSAKGVLPVRMVVRTRVQNNFRVVFARFDRHLFEVLNPPLPPVKVLRFDGCARGDEVHLELNFLFARSRWISRITETGETDSEIYFVDEGVKLPPVLKSWRHKHRICRVDEAKTDIVDDVQYQTLTPPLTAALYGPLYGQLLYRKPVYKRMLGK